MVAMAPFRAIRTCFFLFAAASTAASTASPAASITGSSATTSVDTSGEYSLTAEPAVLTAAPCVQNCLSPYQMEDPSDCDDVTNDCACLSAPAGILDVIGSCLATVCTESASQTAFSSVAAGLYSSYCAAHYNAAQLSSASSAEASSDSAAAASSTASESSGSGGSTTGTATGTTSASAASASSSGAAVSTRGPLAGLLGCAAVMAAVL